MQYIRDHFSISESTSACNLFSEQETLVSGLARHLKCFAFKDQKIPVFEDTINEHSSQK